MCLSCARSYWTRKRDAFRKPSDGTLETDKGKEGKGGLRFKDISFRGCEKGAQNMFLF